MECREEVPEKGTYLHAGMTWGCGVARPFRLPPLNDDSPHPHINPIPHHPTASHTFNVAPYPRMMLYQSPSS